MKFSLEFSPAAARFLKKISDEDLRKKILFKIELLSKNPHPNGCKKLAGNDSFWRIRVGDYRIVYEVHSNKLIVLIVRVGNRKDIYRSMQ